MCTIASMFDYYRVRNSLGGWNRHIDRPDNVVFDYNDATRRLRDFSVIKVITENSS